MYYLLAAVLSCGIFNSPAIIEDGLLPFCCDTANYADGCRFRKKVYSRDVMIGGPPVSFESEICLNVDCR